MDSLALTASFFKFDSEFSDLDKILYLVERMNQSKGVLKSQKRSGVTL